MAALKSLSSRPIIFVPRCLHLPMARCPGFLDNRELAVEAWGSSCHVKTLRVWLKPSTWLQQKGEPCLVPVLPVGLF